MIFTIFEVPIFEVTTYVRLTVLTLQKYGKAPYMSTGGGLKGYPPLENFKKGTPHLKILPAQPAKIFKAYLVKILGKIAKFGAKTAKFQ